MINEKLSYTLAMHKSTIGNSIMIYGRFTRTSLILLAMVVSACQSIPSDQSKVDETSIVGNLNINMLDMGYSPSKLQVAKAGHYLVTVSNTASIPHDIVFSNGIQLAIAPGLKASTSLYIPDSGLNYFCSLPGHKEAGMTGIITLNNEAPSAIKIEAGFEDKITPIAADYKLYDPKVSPLLPFETHNIYLVAEEKLSTVAKGVSQQLWTYNGKVPGPLVHVRVGDTVRVHLSNPSFNKLAHSVDFHASQVAWNDEMTSINPGEEKLYEFRADYAGEWMYHSGSNPAPVSRSPS